MLLKFRTREALRLDEIENMVIHVLKLPELQDAIHTLAALSSIDDSSRYGPVLYGAQNLVERGKSVDAPDFQTLLLPESMQRYCEGGDWRLVSFERLFGPTRIPKPLRGYKDFPGDGKHTCRPGFLQKLAKVDRTRLDPLFGQRLIEQYVFFQIIAETRGLGARVPSDPKKFLEERIGLLELVQSSVVKVGSLNDEWRAHKARLEQLKGKSLIGLPSGLDPLDKSTLGLRGLMLLGAMPNVGKTALALQIALNVCEVPDAAVLMLSLDMSRGDMYARIHSNLSGIDYRQLLLGSCSELPQRLVRAERWVEEHGRRLKVVDRRCLSPRFTARAIARITQEHMRATGASRILIIVDYLQLVPVPEETAKTGDGNADRYRVSFLQDLLSHIESHDDASPNCILAISEARKPQGKGAPWGSQLEDLIGSVRLAYAADGVLMYRKMNNADMSVHYRLPEAVSGNQRSLLEQQGISPVILTLVKGRDGMSCGSFPLEFEFRRSKFRLVDNELRTIGPRDLHVDIEESQKPNLLTTKKFSKSKCRKKRNAAK